MNDKVNKIKADLQHFCGTEMFFKIPLIGTRFNDGLKYLANEAECFWLITDASVIAKSLSNRSSFITIDVEQKFGNHLKRYAEEHLIEYDTLLEDEALRNLYYNDCLTSAKSEIF